jgi:hypothetical protein
MAERAFSFTFCERGLIWFLVIHFEKRGDYMTYELESTRMYWVIELYSSTIGEMHESLAEFC